MAEGPQAPIPTFLLCWQFCCPLCRHFTFVHTVTCLPPPEDGGTGFRRVCLLSLLSGPAGLVAHGPKPCCLRPSPHRHTNFVTGEGVTGLFGLTPFCFQHVLPSQFPPGLKGPARPLLKTQPAGTARWGHGVDPREASTEPTPRAAAPRRQRGSGSAHRAAGCGHGVTPWLACS